MSLNFYFEEFCFDLESEQLLKNGSPLSLTAKSLEVLLVLIKKNGKFVKKDEIIEQVWSDNFVEEANLTQHIYLLRKILGQTKDGQQFIKTLPKKGYCFTSQIIEKNMEDAKPDLNLAENNEISQNANQKMQLNKDLPKISNQHEGYQFGEFCIDKQRRLLYRENQPITLPAKVFDTLLYLLENAGRLITKDELMDKIWQDRFVEENNLTQKIFIIRRILGDDKNNHQYIVTVPGEGYIFVAPVVEITAQIGVTSNQSQISPSVVVGEEPLKNTLAVLPFKIFASETAVFQENYLGVGLTDATILHLSHYDELILRPTAAVLKYSDSERNHRVIGKDLQVYYLVEGLIQQFDSRIKISVQLFESESGKIIWADDFVGKNEDVIQLQDKIAEQISKELARKLNFEPLAQVNFLPTNFDAFQEYIKGKFYWNKRTVDGLKKAILHAQNTLNIEPTFAMAYVGLADSYNLLAGQHAYLPPKEAFPKARAASQKALEITNGTLAEAYTSLAFTTYYYERNRPLAEEYFERAIKLKPHYPTSYHWHGEALASEGRFEEAIQKLKKAQELDPLSPAITTDLAQVFLLAGRIDECRYLLNQLLEINPQFINALYFYALLYERLGDFPKAVEVLSQAVEISPDEPTLLAELACVLAYSGNETKARQILNELKQMGERRYISGVLMATIHLALNELKEVYQWIDRAIENREVWLIWTSLFPELNRVINSEKFIPLMTKFKENSIG